MSNFTPHLNAPDTASDLWDWWHTLSEDQRDLLRMTASSLPLSPHVVDFLAWSRCPSVDLTDDAHTGVVRDPARFTTFVAHA